MRKRIIVLVLAFAILLFVICSVGCGGATGVLEFRANGEDFIRQGFESKDGWDITFEHVYINLAEVTGYQADPPYDPNASMEIIPEVTVSLGNAYTIDLAAGGADADTIVVGQPQNVKVGYYTAISWKMLKATTGPADGYSLVMIGSATKAAETVDFTIKIESEYAYLAGEYLGDDFKGIVEEGQTSDIEMTFHFDHIFGDAETAADDALNIGAPGFGPFADLATAGTLDINMTQIEAGMDAGAYQKLVDMLPTLGHVGE